MARAALALCLALALAVPCLVAAGEDAAWTHWATQTQGHRRSLMTAAQGPNSNPCMYPKPTTCAYLPLNFSLIIQPSCSPVDPCQANPTCPGLHNCLPGFMDCDSNPFNLCETWTGTPWAWAGADWNCGACGNDCTKQGKVCGVVSGAVQCVEPGAVLHQWGR